MTTKRPFIPLQVTIEIELLKFKDSLANIDKSRQAGHIGDTSAHRMKNQLAWIYAEHIARLVEKEENRGQ